MSKNCVPGVGCEDLKIVDDKVDNLNLKVKEKASWTRIWTATLSIICIIIAAVVFLSVYFSDMRLMAKDYIQVKESMDKTVSHVSRNTKTSETNEQRIAKLEDKLASLDILLNKMDTTTTKLNQATDKLNDILEKKNVDRNNTQE